MYNTVYGIMYNHRVTTRHVFENGVSVILLLNQYSPVPRARSSIAGKDATGAQIYAGLGTGVVNVEGDIRMSRSCGG